MIKKLNFVELVVQAFIVLLFATCLWVIPLRRTPNFWVSFCFSLTSLIIFIYLSSRWRKKETPSEKFLHLIYPVGSILIFLIQTVWNLFVLFMSTVTFENILGISKDSLFKGSLLQGVPVKAFVGMVSYVTKVDILDIRVINIAVPLNIIVNLLCTIMYISIIYWMFGSAKEIHNVDEHIKTSTSFIRDMETELRILAQTSLLRADIRDALEVLADQVKYSDPVSSHAVKSVESDIRKQMEVLTDSILRSDNEKTVGAVNRITTLLEQRSFLCKNSK